MPDTGITLTSPLKRGMPVRTPVTDNIQPEENHKTALTQTTIILRASLSGSSAMAHWLHKVMNSSIPTSFTCRVPSASVEACQHGCAGSYRKVSYRRPIDLPEKRTSADCRRGQRAFLHRRDFCKLLAIAAASEPAPSYGQTSQEHPPVLSSGFNQYAQEYPQFCALPTEERVFYKVRTGKGCRGATG